MKPNPDNQPDPTQLYKQWKASPNPGTLTPLVSSLRPTIDSALRTYGYADDPNMRTTAQLHVIKALPRYDPKRAKLNTFVFNELKRIQRFGPKQQHAIPIPEQAALDLRSLQRIEHDLVHELGREPTPPELADKSGLSVRRINSIRRRYAIPTVTEQAFESDIGVRDVPATRGNESERLWLDALYAELDPIDKKILDWSLGMHGQPRISKTQMATKLGISIPAITQRARRLSARVSEGMEYEIL